MYTKYKLCKYCTSLHLQFVILMTNTWRVKRCIIIKKYTYKNYIQPCQQNTYMCNIIYSIFRHISKKVDYKNCENILRQLQNKTRIEGKYSLESTDPHESEIRTHPHS